MAGLQYNNTQSQGGTTGLTFTFPVKATHSTLLAPGDAVIMTGDGDPVDGRQFVDTGAASTRNTGVIISVQPQFQGENLTETGLPALTAGNVLVNVDQNALFEMEADATYSVDNVGLNTGINTTVAAKSGGLTISNMDANQGSVATSTLLPYRVVALLEGKTSGVLGDRVLLRPNASTASVGAAGI